MQKVVAWIQAATLEMGGVGLFTIAFLDSSLLSLPEINDLLIIVLVAQHKERMLYYVAMAAGGSIAGCLLMYGIGRKGGDALVIKRFGPRRIERARTFYAKYGVFTIIVPALLPPPAPFKIFVLLAGVVKMPLVAFVAAVGVGRSVRYFVEGVLAVWYGQAAMEYVHANGRTVAIAAAVAVLLGGVLYVFVRRWLARRRLHSS
ncbi:MAG: DedA family protein [Acidobacteria bacterium]|nr:DedA family protein [Acidobacteriota bacterium]